MVDLISRRNVLEALSIFRDRTNGNEHFLNGIETAKEIIENAPQWADTMDVVQLALDQGGQHITVTSNEEEEYITIFPWDGCCDNHDTEVGKTTFTPNEVLAAIVAYGQKDRRFKLGDTIMYSPSEIHKILTEVAEGHETN